MKIHMLYAPALLLALSVSCGKASHKDDLANPAPIELTSDQQAKIDAAIANPVVSPVLSVPVSAPAAVNANVSNEASAPATATPNVAAQPEAEAAPVVSAPVAVEPPVEAVPFATTSLSSGVPAVDTICNKSFASFDALVAGDIAAFQALKLTTQTNTTCFNLLVANTGKLFDDLEVLGYPNMGLSTASIVLSKATWPSYAANAGLVTQLQSIAASMVTDEENNNLAQASEELRYIDLSIAELNAKPDAEFTAEDQQNLIILLSSREVQAGLVTRIQTRVAKFKSLINYMDLGLIVSQIGQILANPAALAAPEGV